MNATEVMFYLNALVGSLLLIFSLIVDAKSNFASMFVFKILPFVFGCFQLALFLLWLAPKVVW